MFDRNERMWHMSERPSFLPLIQRPHMCSQGCTALFRHQCRAEHWEAACKLAPHRSPPSAEVNASTCVRLRCNTPISWVTDGGGWEVGEKTRHWLQQHIWDVWGIKNIDYPASSSPPWLQFRWMGWGWGELSLLALAGKASSIRPPLMLMMEIIGWKRAIEECFV